MPLPHRRGIIVSLPSSDDEDSVVLDSVVLDSVASLVAEESELEVSSTPPLDDPEVSAGVEPVLLDPLEPSSDAELSSPQPAATTKSRSALRRRTSVGRADLVMVVLPPDGVAIRPL
jgi:hypothetical protein